MSSQESFVENENLIKQSLEHFKNWLSKHPFIKFSGDENIEDILMHFLRLKKFSMDRVFECFESFVIFLKSHPEWFGDLSPDDYTYTKQPDSSVIVMKNNDAEGRRIFISRSRFFDRYNDPHKMMRSKILHLILLSFNPQVVENGLIVINDARNTSLKSFSKVPPATFNESYKIYKKGIVRVKLIFVIGMPTFIVPVYELVKSFTSKKVAERMHAFQNIDDLQKYMDVSYLPEDYGGSATELADFEDFENGIKFLKLMNKFEVDFSRVQGFESVGSFRKLQVD